MDSTLSVDSSHEFRQFASKINALSCIKFLIALEISIKAIKSIFIGAVLYIKRNETCEVPLKAFLAVYMLLSIIKGVTFYLKNRSFFRIRRIPEFEESSGAALVNNFLEAALLFWYIIGFHWIQECTTCREENSLLYYTSIFWIFVGFLTFVTPLIAIILLLLLVTYARPKLKIVTYEDGNEIPDSNRRCAICIDDYTSGSKIKFLPCKHHFHMTCIDEWFAVRDSCPLCNRHVNMLYDLVDPTNVEV